MKGKKTILSLGIVGSLIGCAYVSLGEPLIASIIWVMSNPLMLYYNFRIKEYAQSSLWLIYILLAIAGVFNNI